MTQDERAFFELLMENNQLLKNSLLEAEKRAQNVELFNQILRNNNFVKTPTRLIYSDFIELDSIDNTFQFKDQRACMWRLVIPINLAAFDVFSAIDNDCGINKRRYGKMLSEPYQERTNFPALGNSANNALVNAPLTPHLKKIIPLPSSTNASLSGLLITAGQITGSITGTIDPVTGEVTEAFQTDILNLETDLSTISIQGPTPQAYLVFEEKAYFTQVQFFFSNVWAGWGVYFTVYSDE